MHSVGMFEDDGAGSSAAFRWGVNNSATEWMKKFNGVGTLQHTFYLNSFLSNGFRLTHVSNANDTLSGTIYNYLVMWGTDITVNSGTWNARTTAGTDTNAHSLGAAPRFVMLLSGALAFDNSFGASGEVAIGMASSTTVSNQVCMAAAVENGRNTMDTWRYMPADKAIGILDALTGTIDAIGTVTTMDDTNFIVNWSDAASSAWRVSWLAIAGGSHDVHAMTAPASIANQSKTGLSFTPEGLFAFSRGATATTTSDVHAMISVGAAKSSSLHRNALYTSEDATANAEALARSSSAYIIETSPTAVAATASSTAAPNMQIELVSFASGQYTWHYDATTSGFITGVWAFAQTSSIDYNGTVNESVSVSEAMQRNITVTRPVTQSVAVTEAISRGVGRTVAESVTVDAESITQQLGARRTATETVGIEEVVGRSGSFDRQFTETPVNVSDNITRNVTVTRPVTESVAVSEQITAAIGYQRTIAESVTVLGENEFNLDEFNIQEFGSPGYEKVRAQATHPRTVSESVSVSEQITSNFGYSQTVSESVAVSDSVTKSVTYQRALSESVAVSELVSGGSNTNYFRVVDENVSISENFVAAIPRVRGRARRIGSSNKPSRIESRKGTGGDIEA